MKVFFVLLLLYSFAVSTRVSFVGKSVLTRPKVDLHAARGCEIMHFAVSSSQDHFKSEVTKQAQSLQIFDQDIGKFVSLVDNLVKAGLKALRTHFDEDKIYIISPMTYKLAEKDLKRRMFALLLPFYRRQLQLIRIHAVKLFNVAASSDMLPLTVYIIDELQLEKQQSLKLFESFAKRLLNSDCYDFSVDPMYANVWKYEQRLLDDSISDYISQRQQQLQAQLILPHKRNPVSVSFATLVSHPFGRDYRQDVVLGGPQSSGSGDKLMYDPLLHEKMKQQQQHQINAHDYHKQLKQQQQAMEEESNRDKSLFSRYFNKVSKFIPYTANNKLHKNVRFSREMFSFPLNIKNPNVPFVGHRVGKAASNGDASRIDQNSQYNRLIIGDKLNELTAKERSIHGPERYIDWKFLSALRNKDLK